MKKSSEELFQYEFLLAEVSLTAANFLQNYQKTFRYVLYAITFGVATSAFERNLEKREKKSEMQF